MNNCKLTFALPCVIFLMLVWGLYHTHNFCSIKASNLMGCKQTIQRTEWGKLNPKYKHHVSHQMSKCLQLYNDGAMTKSFTWKRTLSMGGIVPGWIRLLMPPSPCSQSRTVTCKKADGKGTFPPEKLGLLCLTHQMSIEWEAVQRRKQEVLLGSDRTQQPGPKPAESTTE